MDVQEDYMIDQCAITAYLTYKVLSTHVIHVYLVAMLRLNVVTDTFMTFYLQKGRFPTSDPALTLHGITMNTEDVEEALLVHLAENSFVSVRQLA
jgi:hypothetical protein